MVKPLVHDQDPRLVERFSELLIASGGSPRSVDIYVELRGIGCGEPKSLRGVGRDLSAERIRQLVREIESSHVSVVVNSGDPAVADLKADVQATISEIERHAPGSSVAIRDSMAKLGVRVGSPAGLVRLADILGCKHEVRLAQWVARAKYKDREQRMLAAYEDEAGREAVTAIVPVAMPAIFDSFINYARKFSRGAGVIAAGYLADRYSRERGVAVTQAEALAFLVPFAVHLGRYEGDEWFAFFNSANDFLRKASTRVSLFGRCSFELLCDFHRRYNRSVYISDEAATPPAVLRAAIELAGFTVNGDVVSPNKKGETTSGAGRGASEMQTVMVRVFRETLAARGGKKSIPRAALVDAMRKAGIRESTAHMYLGNQGLFICKKGLCQLADSCEAVAA